MTLAQEGQFWVQRMQATRKGSLRYIEALDEVNKTIARMRAENARGSQEFDEITTEALRPDNFDMSRSFTGDQGRDNSSYLHSLNEGITLQRQNANAIEETNRRMTEAAGEAGKLDAAQQQAALHTCEYEQAMAALLAALADVATYTGLTPVERATATSGLNNQMAQLQGQRTIQAAQDQQAISQQQIGPAMHEALDQMVTAWKTWPVKSHRPCSAP